MGKARHQTGKKIRSKKIRRVCEYSLLCSIKNMVLGDDLGWMVKQTRVFNFLLMFFGVAYLTYFSLSFLVCRMEIIHSFLQGVLRAGHTNISHHYFCSSWGPVTQHTCLYPLPQYSQVVCFQICKSFKIINDTDNTFLKAIN